MLQPHTLSHIYISHAATTVCEWLRVCGCGMSHIYTVAACLIYIAACLIYIRVICRIHMCERTSSCESVCGCGMSHIYTTKSFVDEVLSHMWMRHITLRSECMEADVCTYACVRKSVCVIEARLTNDEVLSHTWMLHITIRSAQKMFWICYIIVYIFLSSVYGWGLRASGLWLWV